MKRNAKQKIEISKLPEIPNVCRQILREVWKSKSTSIAHVTMNPGNISLLHKHNKFTELYYILEGKGTLWLDNKKINVMGGTLIEVVPGTPHKLKNTGKSKLKHLVISTPAFDPKDVIIIKSR